VRLLTEHDAYALLANKGIPCAPSAVLAADVNKPPPLPFSYPVAAKILSADIAHKTDAGGIVLGIADGDALLAGIEQIRTRVSELRPDVPVERILVQPMIAGLGEALVGYRVDADVGPLIMVAAGGIFTEIYRDRSLRLAPVDLAIAQEMIAEVRGLLPLAGYRGKPKGDLDALAEAIVALSRLVEEPGVAEAEINPLIVRPQGGGVIAVDAVIHMVV
jgi:acyl-CoA synthetase (NDP forming)